MSDEKLRLEDLISGEIRIEESERIEDVTIIGGGVMGRGIAQTIAGAGIDVLLLEKNEDSLERAKERLKAELKYEISRWAMTESEMKSILSRIKWSVDINEIKNADVVIEAVSEDMALKEKIFRKIDEIAKEKAIFISNTSTLSLSTIASMTKRPEQVIGMHFLNPVPKVPLVELIKGIETSNKTVEIVKEFASRIGKTPVEVYEYPGFVSTRAIVPLLNEAMYILLEGVASAKDIDTAMKLGYEFKKGPLEMADSMGLDEVLIWMEQLWKTLGEPRYRPCPILRKLVREKKLGKKTGEGFFKYDENGNIIG